MIIIIIIIDMISDFVMKRQYATCWESINENHNVNDFKLNWSDRMFVLIVIFFRLE